LRKNLMRRLPFRPWMIAPGITSFGWCLGFSLMIGLNRRPMSRRGFSHANNPDFACAESVLLLPFGRRSFLPEIVEAWDGEETVLDETTDREVY
jgi:hypothetical protein